MSRGHSVAAEHARLMGPISGSGDGGDGPTDGPTDGP